MSTSTLTPDDAAAALLDYVEGTMAAGERAAFETRLAGDAALRDEVALLGTMHHYVQADAKARVDFDAPPPHLMEAIVRAEGAARSDAVRQAAAKSNAPSKSWWQRLAMVAVPGGALAMGAMAVVVMQRQPEPAMKSVAESASANAAPTPSPMATATIPTTPEPIPVPSAATAGQPGSGGGGIADGVAKKTESRARPKDDLASGAAIGGVQPVAKEEKAKAGPARPAKASLDDAPARESAADVSPPAAAAPAMPPRLMSPTGDLRRQRSDLALQGYVTTAFRELEQGRFRDALDLFDQARMLDGRNPYVAAGLASSWMGLKNPSKAVLQAPLLLAVPPNMVKDDLIVRGIMACAQAAEQTAAKPLALQLWRKVGGEPAYKDSAKKAIDRLK